MEVGPSADDSPAGLDGAGFGGHPRLHLAVPTLLARTAADNDTKRETGLEEDSVPVSQQVNQLLSLLKCNACYCHAIALVCVLAWGPRNKS